MISKTEIIFHHLFPHTANLLVLNMSLLGFQKTRNKLDDKNVVGAVLTDLFKAFDCISHDLLVAKLVAYGFNRDTVAYIYSYLKNKHCAKYPCIRYFLRPFIPGYGQ